MQAVILAAGIGERLGRLSMGRSKAMQPVLGKPILQRVIEGLQEVEISDFLVAYNPDDIMLQSYFQKPPSADIQIRLFEQTEPLGTAHALACLASQIIGDFFLTACDNILASRDLERMHVYWESSRQTLAGLLALVRARPDEIRDGSGIVLDQENVIRIVEKPAVVEGFSSLTSIALYIFSDQILEHLEHVQLSVRGEYELADAIQSMIDRGNRVGGFEVSGRLTLTHPEDLLRINRHFLQFSRKAQDSDTVGSGGDTRFIEPVYIEQNVIIGAECRIGPEVYLEKGCQIGAGSVIQRAVILKDVVLPPGSEVIDQVICV